MKTKQKTIQSVATEMYKNLEQKERTNGDKYICPIKTIEWQQNIIRSAHGDKLPDDYVYEFIYEALERLSDSDEGNEDEALYSIEPDVYTSNLTKWLNSTAKRVYYVTEALEQFEPKDGFALLSQAYNLEQVEVGQALLQGIKDYIEA